MKTTAAWTITVLCVLGCTCAAGETTAPDKAALEKAWSRVESRPPDLSSPELLGFALNAAAAGAEPRRIEAALKLAESMQDRDPNSPGFGNFRWYRKSTAVKDFSAVEFTMQRAALLSLKYHKDLSKPAAKRLDRILRFAVHGLRRHRVPESHTNIFLMKAWNCLAIGQATNQPDLSAEGTRMLDGWLLYTWERGVREFASPAYYGVNLSSLGLIARWIDDPAVVEKAEAALGLFWTDIAANWFAPTFRLAGSRSRDYDRLTGHGHLDAYLAAAGWIPADQKRTGDALLSMSLWKPPAALTKPILSNRPRTVLRRWGKASGEYAVTYVSKGVSLGTSGAGFGPADRVLGADLGGGPGTAMVSFLMDGRNDAYGAKPRLAGAGHRKTHHLTPFVTTIQRGPEALLLASADTANKRHFRYVTNPDCLLSHLILPKADEVWIARRKVDLDERGDAAAVHPGEPVFVRLGKSALAVRILLALDTAGNPAPTALYADGYKHGAMRLTVAHSPDAPKGRGTVAMWVRVGEKIDDADDFADFRKDFDSPGSGFLEDGRADVSANGLDGKLRLFADLWKQRRIAIGGGDQIPARCVLAIDGLDQGRRLLGASNIVSRYRALLECRISGTVSAGQVMEAERADLATPPLVVGNDSEASGGRFIRSPAQAYPNGAALTGRCVWAVNVPASGLYAITARCRRQANRPATLAVRIRQRGRDMLARTAWPQRPSKRWKWLVLPKPAGRGAIHVRLHAGPTAVEVFNSGAMLDAVRLEPVKR